MATGVIVVGVVTGPTAINCYQRDDFGACMTQNLFGSGDTPRTGEQAASTETDAAEDDQQDERQDANEDVESEDGPAAVEQMVAEPDIEQATDTAAAEPVQTEPLVPSLDLVRVEPDGSAVVAGAASPSGEVEIFADDEQLGSETASAAGDWVFVTTDPLPTGGVELRVLDVETGEYASSSIMVVVQDDRASEPLVVASQPGEASEILQGLSEPQPLEEAEAAEPLEEADSASTSIEGADPLEPLADEPVAERPAAREPSETIAIAQTDPMETVDQADPAPRERTEPDADAAGETSSAPLSEPAVPGITQEPTPESETPVTAEDVEPASEPTVPAESVSESEPMPDKPAPQVTEPVEPPAQPESDPASSPTAVAEAPEARSSEAELPEAEAATPAQAEAATTEPEAEPATRSHTEAEASEPEAEPVAPALTEAGTPESEAEIAAPAEVGAETPETGAEPAETEVAAAPAQLDEPAATPEQDNVTAEVPATIDAVEIDGDLNFFAGAGPEGMTVRLYVDNQLVGTTQVTDGRWLVEAINVLTEPEQRVRVDMIGEDGSVVARAEVDFQLDLPPVEDEDRLSVAQQEADADAGMEPSAMPGESAASDTTQEPAPEPEAPVVAQDVEPATDPVRQAEPASEPEPTPEEPAPQEAAPVDASRKTPTATPDASSQAERAPEQETPDPGPVEQPAAPAELPTDAVQPQPEIAESGEALDEPESAPMPEPAEPAPSGTSGVDTADDDVPTLVGVTENGRTTSGLAIIRRGDNLWTIARRVYGEGIRYTQIYDANNDQIRDPDLIYPGQVFDLPGTDAVVGEEEEGAE